MGIIVNTVGVVVAGSVTRKYDSGEDQTTLDVTFEQARELHDSLGTVLKFFTETSNTVTLPAPSIHWSTDEIAASKSSQ